MKFLKVFFSLCICFTAVLGDYVVFRSSYSQSQLFRAFSDGVVHLAIGFISALAFFSHEINVSYHACLFNVILCTMISSAIDVDHAFVAKSFYLKDMIGLKQRGIFHCTTLWLTVTSLLLAYSYLVKRLNIFLLSWMLIIAYSSHHIRDANRRGIWLYPFGHTPAITKYLYIFLVSVLPHLYAFVYKYLEPSVYKHTVVNYDYKIVV